jgi:hypothetical protein
VVLADHGVAAPREHAREAIADHRRAQVTDVHLLRDVRVRVVDHDAIRMRRGRDAELRLARDLRRRVAEPVGAQRQVEEARPADRDVADDAVRRERGGDPLGDLPRRCTDGARQGGHQVGLQVRARRAAHEGIHIRVLCPERGCHGAADDGAGGLEYVHHGGTSTAIDHRSR